MKKYIAILLALACLVLAGCADGVGPDKDKAADTGSANTLPADSGSADTAAVTDYPDDGGNVRLTFAESVEMSRIEQLAGRTVEIIGYMATVSPVSGKYMYLMNLPYQSCPYCVPNTNQLSNTIAVYAPEGDKFEFTDAPINVVGVLETGDFEDEYGYTYNYRIKDAEYTEVNSSEASEKLALWKKMTDSGLASDVYAMIDVIYFECNWPNYTGTDADGNKFYLYPADVEYIEKNQFKVEDYDKYFDPLAKSAGEIGDEVMNELVSIINDGKTLVKKAAAERTQGNYTYDSNADMYSLNNGEELMSEAQDISMRYAYWLENFSLSK